MVTVVYDGTFEGFISSVFDVYEYKFQDVNITSKENFQLDVFQQQHESYFNKEKFDRVMKGLSSKVSAGALRQLYKTFLSEEKGIENILLQYIKYAFKNKTSIEYDFTHHAVLKVTQTSKIVHRESHRMEAFIRFQLTKDNIYYAICEPDFNVLPLIEKHFKDRYADQKWLIYDNRRKYGLYYDTHEVENIQLTFNEGVNESENIEVIFDADESLYQKLWQQYFNSVNIKARKNTKLHVQHMPKRYWKYLPEKKGLV